MRLPAIVTRRLQQYRLIRSMGGTHVNAMRMLFTGRSGKFACTWRPNGNKPTKPIPMGIRE